MNNKKKHYIQFISITLGALILSYGLSQLPTRYFSTSHFWIPTIFFALSAIGINAFLTKENQDPKEFVFKTALETPRRSAERVRNTIIISANQISL